MQEIELQQRCTAFQELAKDEQYRLIQELLAKRNDPEAQQLLDRYMELFYAMHKSKTETKKEKREWRLSVARVVIGLAGCLVLVVPVAAKCHSLWKEYHQPEVDPGYTLDGSENIPGGCQEEKFESIEAIKERYPTMQLPTIIPDGYILCDAIVYLTSGSITISIGYHKENEGALSIIIEQYNPELTKGSVNVEQNYESEEFFTYNGIEYCEVSNLERHSIFWTVREVDFDKFYSVFFPMEIDAETRKEIVFSFQ